MTIWKTSVVGALAIACAACSPSKDVLPKPLTPTSEQLRSHLGTVATSEVTYLNADTGEEQKIGFIVKRGLLDFSKKPPRVYFEVAIDLGAEAIDQYGRGFPPGHLEQIPDDLISKAQSDIQDRKPSQNIVKLASRAARASICGENRLAMDPRKGTMTSFTPEQSARISSTLGGNPSQLLGMSQSDLARLGLNDISPAQTRRIPRIDFDRLGASGREEQADVLVRMVCYL